MFDKELLKTAANVTKDMVMKMIETECFTTEKVTVEQVATAYRTIFDVVVSSFVEKRMDEEMDLSSIKF